MIKPEYQSLDNIVALGCARIEIPDVGHFVFDESHAHKPSWLQSFFGNMLDQDLKIFTSSSKGLLVVPIRDGIETVYFAISFGVGRHLLNEGVIEERFGLKTVLNSVSMGSFRSIAKTTLSSVPKQSQEQMSRDVSPAEFGIDIEQDLVSSVTGKSSDEKIGKTITGKDALSTSVKINVTQVVDFLSHCLTRYQSSDYKRDFDWIDQIAEVRDSHREATLNELLVSKMNLGDLDKIWMAVPEIIPWSEVMGFRYIRAKRADLHDDLDVPTLISELNSQPVTIDALKEHSVFLISAATEDVLLHWPAFRCMYAEIVLDGSLYILNNGKWYMLAQTFTNQVVEDFQSTLDSTIVLPDCCVNDEGEYNLAAHTSLPLSCCMDKKLVSHGGGHGKVEFCDLFTNDKRIVHIKRYGGSSVLSHLFAQGVVSGELFVGDADFRAKLNPLLSSENRLADTTQRPNTGDYEIVYGIISNNPGSLDIPFFSKVNLRTAKRRLKVFGYKVGIKKIQKRDIS